VGEDGVSVLPGAVIPYLSPKPNSYELRWYSMLGLTNGSACWRKQALLDPSTGGHGKVPVC
jgi:hypothetical protein